MKNLIFIPLVFIATLLKSQSNSNDCVSVFDTLLNREIFLKPDSMPQFPGGIDSILTYIQNNLIYPAIADYCIEGKVFISFIVEPDGNLTNLKVIRSLDQLADTEALKVIKKMPKWLPAKCNGKFVPARFIVPVNFALY